MRESAEPRSALQPLGDRSLLAAATAVAAFATAANETPPPRRTHVAVRPRPSQLPRRPRGCAASRCRRQPRREPSPTSTNTPTPNVTPNAAWPSPGNRSATTTFGVVADRARERSCSTRIPASRRAWRSFHASVSELRWWPHHCVRQRRHRRATRDAPSRWRSPERSDIPVAAGAVEAAGNGLPRSGRVRARPDGQGGVCLPAPATAPLAADNGPLHHRHGHVVTRSDHTGPLGPLDQRRPGECSSNRGSRTGRRDRADGGAAFVGGDASPAAERTSSTRPRQPTSCSGPGAPIVMAGLDVTSRR